MTEKTIYIAFDGKEFEDYNECEIYESKELSDKYCKDLLVYDINGELIMLNNNYALCQKSVYIICKSEEALNYINKTFENDSTNEIYCDKIYCDGNFPASFYYDFITNKWKEIAPRIKELQDEIDMLSKYIVKE